MSTFAFVCAPKNTNYESIQQTARSIAEQAHVLAYDPNYMSPFAQFACDNGLNVRGKRFSSNYALQNLLNRWAMAHDINISFN